MKKISFIASVEQEYSWNLEKDGRTSHIESCNHKGLVNLSCNPAVYSLKPKHYIVKTHLIKQCISPLTGKSMRDSPPSCMFQCLSKTSKQSWEFCYVDFLRYFLGYIFFGDAHNLHLLFCFLDSSFAKLWKEDVSIFKAFFPLFIIWISVLEGVKVHSSCCITMPFSLILESESHFTL